MHSQQTMKDQFHPATKQPLDAFTIFQSHHDTKSFGVYAYNHWSTSRESLIQPLKTEYQDGHKTNECSNQRGPIHSISNKTKVIEIFICQHNTLYLYSYVISTT